MENISVKSRLNELSPWFVSCVFSAVNTMEKKLAEYKCDTNEALCLKLGMLVFLLISVFVRES